MNQHQSLFDCQKTRLFSDATKSRSRRLEQLDRMERIRTEHAAEVCAALQQDFGRPPFGQLFEIMVQTGVIKSDRENMDAPMAPQPVHIPKGFEATCIAGSTTCSLAAWAPSAWPSATARPASTR